jgi:hypothetical protein
MALTCRVIIRVLAGAMLAACLAASLGAQTPDATKLGGVSGVVAESKSGAPVAKALVILRGNQKASAGDAGIGTRTSASGAFTFSDLEPGAYQITVERAGYVSAPENKGKTVTVKAAENTSDFKLTLLRTGAISGHVFDTDGEPLGRVSIQVLPLRKGATGGSYATTDDHGEYRAFELAPGKYKVVASHQARGQENGIRMQTLPDPDGRATRDAYATVYYPATVDAGQALAVNVEPGSDLRGIDFQMVRVHAVRVHGHVTNPGGLFTMVSLQPSGQGSGGQARDAVVSKGEFELADVLPGAYWLSAVSGGLDSASRSITRRMVQIGDQDIDDLQLALGAGQKLTGRLVAPDGRSLPQGLIVLLESRVPGDQQANAIGQVTSDGTFGMRDVAPGDYDVMIGSVEASDDDLYLASIKMGEADALADGVHIGEAAPDSIVITFKPNGAAIACTVRDDQGSPFPVARVLLVPDAPKTNRLALHGESKTGADGTCKITGITPGDYHLYAMQDDPQIDHRDPDLLKAVQEKGKAVTLAEGQRETLDVKIAPIE